MSWIATAVVGGSIIGGLAAAEDAEDAQHAAIQAGERTSAIDKMLADISVEQWNLYKTEALPLLRELSGMRTDRTAERMASAAGDTKAAFSSARQNFTRALERTRNPGDPGYGALLAPSYWDEAAAVGQAVQGAREAERERSFDRTAQVLQGYQGLPTQAVAAGGAAANTANARAANYQRLASSMNENAAQTVYGGVVLGNAARNWMRSPAPAPAAGGGGGGGYDMTDPYGGSMDWPDDSAGYGSLVGDSPYYAHGGPVRRRPIDPTGKVHGPGTETSDSIPAHLSKGEYVIPADVVKIKGQEFFDKLLQKYHRPVADREQGHMANGGPVVKGRGLPRAVDEAIFRSLPTRAVSRQRR